MKKTSIKSYLALCVLIAYSIFMAIKLSNDVKEAKGVTVEKVDVHQERSYFKSMPLIDSCYNFDSSNGMKV